MFHPDYLQMLRDLRIYTYGFKLDMNASGVLSTSVTSFFLKTLMASGFTTDDPEEAHLFFVPLLPPLDPSVDRKGASRYIRNLRAVFPFWNRTLGADHFFLSCDGVGVDSDRNLVELKKNSVQISCFPVKNAPQNLFVPHKDVTLPPLDEGLSDMEVDGMAEKVLAYYARSTEDSDDELASYLKELESLTDFVIESRPSDPATYSHRLSSSRFCLFFHGAGRRDLDIWSAMRHGCVPVFICSRPILDLPFADVLRWRELALAVAMDGGANRLMRVLEDTHLDSYKTMRDLGRQASVHFRWNFIPQPYDAFHTVMYQLWRRRHVVRYARRLRD
ncbi:putative glycosyltransferase [Nymphaea thermarum]|nr:putative glycosyltransferase [Nymphaea thermarum]